MAGKQETESAAARWHTAAEIKGYQCLVCATTPPYEEREIYFESGLCSWCKHQADKDD